MCRPSPCVITVKSRFNEWPPSAPFHSLNRDFTLNRDFLMRNSILVTRFHSLNRDFTLNRDSLNRDLTVLDFTEQLILDLSTLWYSLNWNIALNREYFMWISIHITKFCTLYRDFNVQRTCKCGYFRIWRESWVSFAWWVSQWASQFLTTTSSNSALYCTVKSRNYKGSRSAHVPSVIQNTSS